jgi:hypothetical protein
MISFIAPVTLALFRHRSVPSARLNSTSSFPWNTRGSHGTSSTLPRPQAIRISLSRLQLSTGGFADLLGHQYSAVCVRLLGVYVLLAQFRLIVQRA